MLCDYHVHLERGPYTLDWLQQFLAEAKRKAIAELGIVEHLYRFQESRHVFHNDWVAERQTQKLQDYLDLVNLARRKRLPIRAGLEVDYIPGRESEIRALVKDLPLDFVTGAVHWLGDWGFDTDKSSWEGRDILTVYEQYYDTLAQAAESGLFDIIAHPGNIGYFGHQPPVNELDRLETEFVKRVQKLRVVVEVNTGGLLRPAHVVFPRMAMLRKLRAAELDIVMSSDAHRPEDVGHALADTERVLKQMTFVCTTRFKNRKASFPAL